MGVVIYTEDEACVSDLVLPIIERCVAEFGHSVLHFALGADAITAIEELAEDVALLVTDLSLSDKVGGLEIARCAAKKGIDKVFVFSSCAKSKDTTRFMQYLVQRYGIQVVQRNKPLEAKTISFLIDTLLSEADDV